MECALGCADITGPKLEGRRLFYKLADRLMWEQLDRWFGSDRAGCYRLHILDDKDVPAALPRLLAVDESGTLYIGTSRDVPNRVASLKKAIGAAYGIEHRTGTVYRNPGEHGAGKKLNMLPALRTSAPFERLFVSVERCESIGEDTLPANYEQEAEQLQAYRTKFGEWPPLNG